MNRTVKILLLGAMLGWVAAGAQTFSTLASFNLNNNTPLNLIQATDGDFYGVASGSGVGCSTFGAPCTVIFKLTPAGALTTLYSFGSALTVNPIVQASDGNFYGTAYVLSSNGCVQTSPSLQCGEAFQLTPAGVFTTLHTFDLADGAYPSGGLVQGKDGSLYGVTSSGGSGSCLGPPNGCGTFFKVSTGGTLTVLHNFTPDEASQAAGLLLASDGNFYGYSAGGGCCGTIIRITPSGSLTIIHSFSNGKDGGTPLAIVEGSDGNLYGATARGTAFVVTLSGTFTPINSLGSQPAQLLSAADGNIYLAAASGFGTFGTFGAIVRFSPASQTSTLVYTFCSQAKCSDGQAPAWMATGSDGNLYGVTWGGGSTGNGTLFELTVPAAVTPPSNLPQILTSGGVLNGASFQTSIASNAWITIKGTNLAPQTDNWNNSISNGVLPMSLDGVTVSVGGQPAYIEYISSTQINAVAPNISAGNVAVTVTTPTGTSQAVTAPVEAVGPAFFQWGNYAVATTLQYSDAVKNGVIAGLTTTAAAPGQVIVLWGTGFGPTSPSVPPGYETPSTSTYNTATPVTVTVGGVSATVYGAALAPGYAGLYQVAIQIPPTLANGDYAIVATVGGVSSPASTLLTVQQ